MGHSTCPSAALLLSAVVLAAGIACGQAQLGLDTSDVFATSGFGLRRLSAYYSRNFVALNAQKCFSSSYFSPYRLYFMDLDFPGQPQQARYSFQLDVASCPVSKAYCCGQMLDHLLIRTGASANVLQVLVDGKDMSFKKTDKGIVIFDLNVNPTSLKSLSIEVFAPANGYVRVSDLCPKSRFPQACDAIAYNMDETCCTERAALPRGLFYRNTTDVEPATKAPPPATPEPPSPPPPPPPSPPPPPPDGWQYCCVDDITKSPFLLKYNGWKRTGSDTAYQFQVLKRKVNSSADDIDGPEDGDCSSMTLRDLGVSIYDNLLVKSVAFNGTLYSHSTEPSAVAPMSKWVYIDLFMDLTDFSYEQAIDYVITVRGKVDSLCPANEFLHSSAACEYAMHGKDGETQCCPHGATKRQGPPDDCCVDDIEKAPYRMQYLQSDLKNDDTTLQFAIKVQDVTGIDFDLEEEAKCDTMTLDYAQIQIYKNVEVLEVKWEERIMTWNTTPATDYSKWLNINGINRYINDFDPNLPTLFQVKVKGWVREPCPAGWLFDAGGAVICEYALHGTQGQHTCCPHHITEPGTPPADCGCRDDVPGTPYRLGYEPSTKASGSSVFNFDLAKVNPDAAKDFDGKPDISYGKDVSCDRMAVKSITFAVRPDLEIEDIQFNGFSYDWQFEPYTPFAKWLKVLDIDYKPADFPDGEPVPLAIAVKGSTQHMCSQTSSLSSQSSCEYYIFGLDVSYSECCPRGLTSWSTPALLGLARH